MKVLVVEDNKPISLVLCAVINGMGHHAIAAVSGEEALLIFKAEAIDLVLMDVEMPGMDGFETTRNIRDCSGDLWIPIIFLSANSEESYLVDGIDAGGDDYLVKPVKPTVLKAKMRAMERIASMRDELRHVNTKLGQVNQELEKANEEFKRLTYLDGLTGIMNRRGFELNYKKEWQRCHREHTPLTLLLIDIDDFKRYNDHYGHLQGDDCLKQVAQTLQNAISRGGDLVARYGGEEFVILLPNTDFNGGRHVAQCLNETIAELNIEHAKASAAQHVTISVGVSSTLDLELTNCVSPPISHDDTPPDALIQQADEALYTAKANGRNQYHVWHQK